MTKIRCLAIDDEPFALEMMADDIQKIPFLQLVGKFTSTASVSYLLPEVDLIFLDINMPTQTGLQFLKGLANPPMVIFTTAYHEFAIEGFDLKVVDYLLKPIPFERFKQATERALELFTLKNNQKQNHLGHSFIIFSEYKQIKIFSDEILYIEGLKDYVKIYLINQSKPTLTRLTLKGIVAKLPESGFCRIHNSYIISIAKISSFQKNRLFILDKELPIGASFYEEFEKKMKG
jgi:DNA-binding LytR/AlgR family response regulator